jgi:hypothetical protein
MPDLTPEKIRALADAAGFELSDDDLDEVTHRVNAFLDALAPLAALRLDEVEPTPVAPNPE